MYLERERDRVRKCSDPFVSQRMCEFFVKRAGIDPVAKQIPALKENQHNHSKYIDLVLLESFHRHSDRNNQNTAKYHCRDVTALRATNTCKMSKIFCVK